MLIFDGHLDLAMNALLWNRDLERPVPEQRAAEAGITGKGRCSGTVAFPEMRAGGVGLCMATVIARTARAGNPMSGYNSPEIAYAAAQGQRNYYLALQEKGVLRILENRAALDRHVTEWETFQPGAPGAEPPPIGVILTMEGADPVLSPRHVETWRADGLRIIGPAHYGVSAYAHGTATPGGLTPLGPELLRAMDRCRMILDVTHLADESFWQALEIFEGPVLASHSNCRALVTGDRQLDDSQIRALVDRDAVIGSALDAWMLYPGWVKGETANTVLSLEAVADQIDHVCQLAGNARHAAIGSDLDGGFGWEQCPHDLETIADLRKLVPILSRRGNGKSDIEAVMSGNWLRLFRHAWRD